MMFFKTRMTRGMRLRAAACGTCLAVTFAIAADKIVPLDVKLGLWQMTDTFGGSGVPPGIAPELLAKMSPEQRAKTEAKLKARAAQGPRIETRNYCLTQEKLNKAAFSNENNKFCQPTVIVSNSRLQQFHQECEESGLKHIVDARFEAIDATTLKGSIQIKAGYKTPVAINTEIAGKWIGADCGDEAQR
jgi:hypothetical protein